MELLLAWLKLPWLLIQLLQEQRRMNEALVAQLSWLELIHAQLKRANTKPDSFQMGDIVIQNPKETI